MSGWSASEALTITRSRADLLGIADAGRYKGVRIARGALSSLDGLAAFTALRGLLLEGGPQDLEPLRVVAPQLEQLVVEHATAAQVDALASMELSRLGLLRVVADNLEAAERLATVDLGRLRGVTSIRLVNDTATVLPIALRWLPALDALKRLALHGFSVDTDAAERLCESGLTSLGYQPASRAVARRVLECLGPRCDVTDHSTLALAPLDRVMRAGGGKGYILGIDLAARWGSESNPEAEGALRRVIARAAPELADRISYDTESSAVWILADDRQTLQRVKRLVAQVPAAD